MILLIHMLGGAAAGYTVFQATGNISTALVAALFVHYFLDLFPHIEYLESVDSSIKKLKAVGLSQSSSDISKVLLDFVLGLAIIFLVSDNSLLVYLFALITIVPDGLTVVSRLFPNKILALHDAFHEKVHFLKNKKTRALNELSARPSIKILIFDALVSKPFRITTQVVVFVVSIILLYS